MKSLRVTFYLLFAGLGMLVALSMGLVMYIQYHRYIKTSYFDTLSRLTALIEKKYPVLKDIDKLKQGAEEDADWFWEISGDLAGMANAFNVRYIYYIEKAETGYVFRMSSEITRNYHPEWLGSSVWLPGTSIPAGIDEAYTGQKTTYSPKPIVNEWGPLVYITTPILDNGKTAGLLGAAYNIITVQALERNARIAFIIAVSVSIAMVAILSGAGSRSVLTPIRQKEWVVRETEERRRETESLARALKDTSESKSAFLVNVSHEMRTPLNAIIGLSGLMLGEKNIDGDMRDNLGAINEAGMMLLGIVNDLLDINKIEAGRLEIVPVEYELTELINDMAAPKAILARDKPVRFDLTVDAGLPLKLFGDELRIKQICGKLLDNAFKYTENGFVEWRVSCEREGTSVWLTSRVRDTGSGIRPADMERLFSDYGQIDGKASRRRGGAGLGLSIARRLAEMVGGTITAESEFGRGSVFTLRVRQRAVTDALIGPERAESLRTFRYLSDKRERNQNLSRVRIPGAKALVVDDVPANLKVSRGLMQPCGIYVDCVSSGQEAIELVRKAEVKYDIIFMDYMMPEMDGIETVRVIRGEIGTMYAKTVPIIALTAADVNQEKHFLQNGFNAFLSKPIDLVRLDAELTRWIRGVER